MILLTSKSFRLLSSPSSSPPTHTCFPSKEETSPPPRHSATLLPGLIRFTTRVSSSPQQKFTPKELAEDIANRQINRKLIMFLLAEKKKRNLDF